jgi:dihydrodipicolinate synthase/N-acetylneuraminate lyase
VDPAPSLRLLGALEAGDGSTTRAILAAIKPFEELRAVAEGGWNVAVVKAAMRIRGLDAGPVRPPASDLPENQREALDFAMTSLGAVT